MKRSKINEIIRDCDAFLGTRRFFLPPFAYWTPTEWRVRGKDVGEIVDRRLGWDITDFGLGDFTRTGLVIFTIRNGDPENLQRRGGKLYAEKILIVDQDQVTPYHFHWTKMEDIINRGGGDLMIQVCNSTEDEGLDDSSVKLQVDGIERTVPAGGTVELKPGESITLPTRVYHQFWGVRERVLAGEVSLVNDDYADNRFLADVGRFPEIEEDEEPLHLLVGDYDHFLE
ncbi:MAG TPA: D-lyxose/D-mannose family sugar isomerase [Chloroflexota bacterium]|nr:D-lyxose/D-mannose family sugar isomerase [Chloroflexota bacterium]